MPRNQSIEDSEERKQRPAPDPEPWEGARRRPADRPRHENAEPESPDPAQASDAIAAEGWGEVIEVCPDDSVDGDFNGQPELESLDETQNWEGVDALQGMQGREEELRGENRSTEEVLADAVADRRRVLIERLDEARELGLGAVFESTIAATAPAAGTSPTVSDEEVLRDQLALIDAAIDQLERRSGQE